MSLYNKLAAYANTRPIILHVTRRESYLVGAQIINFGGWLQHGKHYCSHTAFIYYNRRLNALCVAHNTASKGFHIIKLKDYLASIKADVQADILSDCELATDDYTLCKLIDNKIGTKYDAGAAIGSYAWFKNWVIKDDRAGKEYCTESVISILEACYNYKNALLETSNYIISTKIALDSRNWKVTPSEYKHGLYRHNLHDKDSVISYNWRTF